jgi:hypothetical protein
MVVAFACACGGRAVDGGMAAVDGGAPSSPDATRLGEAGGASGGSHGSLDGASAGEPDMGEPDASTGVIVIGPGGSNAACPVVQPREFGACALPGDVDCKYRYSASCGGLNIATCVSDGTWRVQVPAAECGGPPGPACPGWPPTDGAPCDSPADGANHDCFYPLRCEVISTCYGHWQNTNVLDCGDAGG